MKTQGFSVGERRVVGDARGPWHLVGVSEGGVTGQPSFTHVHCRRQDGECVDLVLYAGDASDDVSLLKAIAAQKRLIARLAEIFAPTIDVSLGDRARAELARALAVAAEGRHQSKDVDRIKKNEQLILDRADPGTHAAVRAWLNALGTPFPTAWVTLTIPGSA